MSSTVSHLSNRLADHDAPALGAVLHAQTKCGVERGRRAAAKALRLAFAQDALGDCAWTDEALADAGIGQWARPVLLDFDPSLSLELAERAPSADGTERLLLRTHDDQLIESVLIPAEKGRKRARMTLCISSQVGCARACAFCETGAHGMVRQLDVREIVDQFRIAQRICEADRPVDKRPEAPPPSPRAQGSKSRTLPAALRPISNIVFMGMGEPMDNLPRVQGAIALLTTPQAFSFAPSRITVSTVGHADKVATFFETTRAELAISINAPDDARRSRIMPINDRYDMASLRRVLLDVMPKGRRVLFQYALFAGFNDSLDDADLLADYVRDIPCRVNVIPANPGPDPTLTTPSPEQVDAFVARLAERGVTTLVRRPRGRDVGGACGQLAGSRREQLLVLGKRKPDPARPG